jgi:hypothetical protein
MKSIRNIFVENHMIQSINYLSCQVLGLLQELVGQNKVVETYVMPFSGKHTVDCVYISVEDPNPNLNPKETKNFGQIRI